MTGIDIERKVYYRTVFHFTGRFGDSAVAHFVPNFPPDPYLAGKACSGWEVLFHVRLRLPGWLARYEHRDPRDPHLASPSAGEGGLLFLRSFSPRGKRKRT